MRVSHAVKSRPCYTRLFDESVEGARRVARAQMRAYLRWEYEIVIRPCWTKQRSLPLLLLAVRRQNGDIVVLDVDRTARRLGLGLFYKRPAVDSYCVLPYRDAPAG